MKITRSSAERGPWIAAQMALHYAVLNERNARVRYMNERIESQRSEADLTMRGCGFIEMVAIFQLNEARNYLGLSAFEYHDPYRNSEDFHRRFLQAALQTGQTMRQVRMQFVAADELAVALP